MSNIKYNKPLLNTIKGMESVKNAANAGIKKLAGAAPPLTFDGAKFVDASGKEWVQVPGKFWGKRYVPVNSKNAANAGIVRSATPVSNSTIGGRKTRKNRKSSKSKSRAKAKARK
jgi:hypothetical protein